MAFPFFGIGMKTDLFLSCGYCWVFQICWHIECSTLTASSFRTWNSSAGILSPLLVLFIMMLPKITADGDCSHEIKRCLLLGRKVMTNLDSIFKSRDITWPTKVRLVKAMLFFLWSCMDVRVGLWRKLSAKELMLLNCGVGEDSWESLGLQGDPISPFWRRSALGFLWKEWC